MMTGWGRPRHVIQIVNSCGYSQEFVAWREVDGYWKLVPSVGDTRLTNRLLILPHPSIPTLGILASLANDRCNDKNGKEVGNDDLRPD